LFVSISNCINALKSFLATVLRYSTRQDQLTYDRHSSNERKQLAVDLDKEFAEGARKRKTWPVKSQPSNVSSSQEILSPVARYQHMHAPKILIGQGHCVQENGEVSLLWYKTISANMYKLELDGQQWYESVGSQTPVSVQVAKVTWEFIGFRPQEGLFTKPGFKAFPQFQKFPTSSF